MMKMFVMHRKVTLSILVMVVLIYGLPGVSYTAVAPAVKPGDNHGELKISFPAAFQPFETRAFELQWRQKTPQGDWVQGCDTITNEGDGGGTADVPFTLFRLKPGTTYQVRYRDINMSFCTDDPPNPDPWSPIGEGTTSGNAPNDGQPGGTTYSVGEEILTLPTGFWTPDLTSRGSFSIIGGKVTIELSNGGLIKEDGITYTCVAAGGCAIEERRVTRGTIQATGGDTPAQPTPPVVSGPEVLVVDPDAPPIYWTDFGTDKIQHVNLDGSNVEDLVTRGLTFPSGVALDVVGGKMYWTDYGTDKIQQANLDGSNVQDLVTRGLDNPHGIALDVVGGKMYWTDYGTDKIQRANLDGSNIEDLVTRGLTSPSGIALDVVGGKMYWTDVATEKIQRANLNGSNVEDLVTQGLRSPFGITLDVVGGKMYWTDVATEKIQRANLNGSNVEDLVTQGLNAPWNPVLDIAGGKMYWTHTEWNPTTEEFTNGKIQRANLNGSNVEDVIIGLNSLAGIALGIPAAQQPAPQPDLVVEAVQVVPATVAPGGKFTLSATLRNQGTVKSASTIVRYYRSPNDTIAANDTQIGIQLASALSANATTRLQRTVTAPTTPGTYYYGVCVDSVTNESNTTNNCSIAVSVTVTALTVVVEDVNADGVVDVQDLVVVAQRYGQTGTNRADVNGDRVVNIDDLILVAAVLDADAAAPSLYADTLEGLTVADVKVWLSQARQRDVMDPSVRRGIQFLEQLLASMVPKETLLLANYPNPFNPETWIPYQLSKPAAVMITIYASNGHVIRQLALGHQPAGMYQTRSRAAYWDGKNAVGEPVASGVYFYTLTAGDFSATRKMLIRK